MSSLNEFANFFTQASTGVAIREVKISTERIKANINWMNHNYQAIRDWLNKHSSASTSASSSQQTKNRITDYRLPLDLTPHYYEIRLKSFLDSDESLYPNRSFSYDGAVNISFTCERSTNKVVLHSKNLEIHGESIQIFSDSDRDLTASQDWQRDEDRDFLMINLNKECIRDHNYTLHISFRGKILDALEGYYKSSYLDSDGKRL